jgi:hypothetical protein
MKITLQPKTLVKSLFLLALLSGSFYSFTNGSGAPAGNTAAPGDGNCTGCHSGSLITSGSNWNNVSITSNIPAAGYTPGDSYTITVSHTQASINKFGFQFTALTASSNAMAGSLIAGTGSQALSSGGKTYLTHNGSGTAGSGSKSWSFSWTAPSPGAGDVKFYLAINATNSDNSTFGDQIYAKNITVSQFSNLPTAVITGIPANNTVCLGDTLHLQGSGINSPTGFSWTFTGKTPSTAQNVDVIFTGIGQKTITLTTSNGFGSSTTNTKFVNVITKPAATITASNVNICGGDSVTLTANFNALFTYQWIPGNETTQNIKTNTPGIYKVKVTSSTTGCVNTSAGVTLASKTKPVPLFTASANTICSADSLTLQASTPYNNYAFFDGNTQIQSGTSPTYKNLMTPGNRDMGLVVTDGNGCNSDTVKEGVNVLPKLAAPVMACGAKTSSSVEFTWGAVAGASGYEVSTDGNIWGAPGGTLSHTVSGLAPNTNVQLWVRALDPGLCAKGNTASQICTNANCTTHVLTLTYVDHICIPSPQDSGYIPILVSSGLSSFSIKFGNEQYTDIPYYTATVKMGNHPLTISVIDSNNIGCPATDTTIMLRGVNPILAKPVILPQTVLCSQDSLYQFKIQNANSGASHFRLYSGNLGIPFDSINANGSAELAYSTPRLFAPFIDGVDVYAMAVEDSFGCTRLSDPLTINIEPTPKVGFTLTPTGLSVVFADTTTGAASRTWMFFGTFPDVTNGAVSITKVYPASGNYQAKLVSTSTNGCSADATQSFTLTNVGLNDVAAIKTISLYPNPVKDVLEINLEGNEPAHVSVYDMQGKLVKEEVLTDMRSLNMAELRNGLYSMYVKQGDSLYNGKFIKE